MLLHRTKTRLKAFLRGDFVRNEDGTIAIEAMIILPVMFWTFLSLFSIFETFRTYSMNQKAAFTIGDAISRETQPIDDQYLTGVWQLYDYLANTRGESSIRVTQLRYRAHDNRFFRDWSQSRGWAYPLSSSDVQNWTDRLPTIPDGERVVLVETWDRYDAPFETGLERQIIHNFVFTRPRYAPRVCWETCD